MYRRFLTVAAIAASAFALSGTASALTAEQFAAICDSGKGECSEHPLLRAYVGGALDLIAVLDEETDYLGEVYCEQPDKLFDVPMIIRYIAAHKKTHSDKNAMVLVVQYLEQKGGC